MFYLQLSRKMFYLQLSPMLNISNVLFAVISVGFGSSLFLLPQFNHFNPLFAATWKNKGKSIFKFDLICAEETKKFMGIKKGGFCVDIEPNIRYSRNQGYLHQSAKGDISPSTKIVFEGEKGMKLVAHLFQEEILKQHKSCSVPPPLQLQREGTPRPLKIQFLERGEEHDKKKQGLERGLDKCPCSCRRVEW